MMIIMNAAISDELIVVGESELIFPVLLLLSLFSVILDDELTIEALELDGNGFVDEGIIVLERETDEEFDTLLDDDEIALTLLLKLDEICGLLED